MIYFGALAVALLSFFNSGNRRVNVEFSYTSESYDSQPVERREVVFSEGVYASKESAGLIEDAWNRLISLGARRDLRAWDAVCSVVGSDVSDEEAREISDVVLNPGTPLGRLWLCSDERLDSSVSRNIINNVRDSYPKWRVAIDALVDVNGDCYQSEFELRVAAYKSGVR